MILDQPFYALPDVAKALGNCSRMTIYRLIESGKLVKVNQGRKALITGRSLADYVDELSTHVPTHVRTRYSRIRPVT